MIVFSIKVQFYAKNVLKMDNIQDTGIKKLAVEEEIVIVVILKL